MATLDTATARVFFEGFLGNPGLDHPEGIAVHSDGSIWCGGEKGQIYRIAADGSAVEEVANTGGFILGLTFSPSGDLFFCDLAHRTVFRLAADSRAPEAFAQGAPGQPFQIPNSLAFDRAGNLYVSDSHAFKEPGPGIFRFTSDGRGEWWYDKPLGFANGLAMSPDGSHLYVAETFANRVSRIPFLRDGSAGDRELVASLGATLPDGLAFHPDGTLYIACYEPSEILRVNRDGTVECVERDVEAHLLCHPTNIAFRGTTVFAANLGRWHITAIETRQKQMSA